MLASSAGQNRFAEVVGLIVVDLLMCLVVVMIELLDCLSRDIALNS